MEKLTKIQTILEKSNIKDEGFQMLSLFVDTLSGNYIAATNLAIHVGNCVGGIKNIYLYNKLLNFIKGVNKNLEKGIKVYNKLFENPRKGKENAKKLIVILDQIDEEEKIDYIVNATYSCMIGKINENYYYRMIKVIKDNLYQDLLYLSNNIRKISIIKGNIQVHSLVNSGLMIQASIDSNDSIEEQKYTFTQFARDLDRYALSLHDEIAQNYYKETVIPQINLVNNPESIRIFTSEEEPKDMKEGDIWFAPSNKENF